MQITGLGLLDFGTKGCSYLVILRSFFSYENIIVCAFLIDLIFQHLCVVLHKEGCSSCEF